MTTSERSTFPTKAVDALLAEDGLPEDVRQQLASAKTYEEQCLALNDAATRLPKSVVDSVNAKDAMLLTSAGVAAKHYLTDRGLIPPAI